MLTLFLAWAPTAGADGDPASDVLASQPLFLPQDAGLSQPEQAQLAALVGEAARAGYPIHVALVASGTDLGSVTELWDQPQSYARFLGEELGLVDRGPLLVVMPDGYGAVRIAGTTATPAAGPLAGLRPPGKALASGALGAVRRLAAAAGHPLALPSGSVARSASHTDLTAWAVFAAGLVLVVVAWGASFRARPPALRGRGVSPAPPRY